MDDETLELLRLLQSGPYDESTWKTVRALLRAQRRLLRAQQDLSTLTDIVHLLDVWSQACESPRIAADVLREAADIAERDVSHVALAADLRKRALARSHEEEPPRAASDPNALLGKRRSDAGDLDGAIEAYERALNNEADMEVVYHLAELYAQRGEQDDAQQAADLYCTLGDVLGHPAGLPMLQRAINQVSDHAEALALFAQYGAAPGGAEVANHNAGQHRPANQNAARQAPAAPAPAGLTSAPLRRARTQTKPGRPIAPIATSPRAQPLATARAWTANAAAPIELDEVDVPIPENTGAMAQPAIANASPAIQQSTASPTTTINPGSGKSIRAFPTRTESGIGPAITIPAPAGAPDNVGAGAKLADPTPIAAVAEAPRSTPEPPQLRAAARRAARQFPAPQPAPVITIVNESAQPSAPSLGPSAPRFQPVTSLSPVVVEDATAVERARARLNAARVKKRKVVAATLATASVAALGLLAVAPRNMQEAQQMAKRMFGGEQSSALTNSASQPATETSKPMAASDQPPPRVETANVATPPATPLPATAAPAPAPAVIPSPVTKAATTLATTPTVRPLFDLAKLQGGKLPDAQLSAALDKAAPILDACYADALAKKPRLKGRLNVGWTIRLNGRAIAVKKRGGTINDVELTRCTLDAIAVTRFPKPRKQPVQVRLPLEYRKQ